MSVNGALGNKAQIQGLKERQEGDSAVSERGFHSSVLGGPGEYVGLALHMAWLEP